MREIPLAVIMLAVPGHIHWTASFVGAMAFLSAAFVAFFIEVRLATAALRIGSPGAKPR